MRRAVEGKWGAVLDRARRRASRDTYSGQRAHDDAQHPTGRHAREGERMEIGTYVRSLLRKSWIIVLLAVLAGAGAYLAERGVRDQYQASVNVTVPAAAAETAGSNGQYVANFSVGLTTPGVIAD